MNRDYRVTLLVVACFLPALAVLVLAMICNDSTVSPSRTTAPVPITLPVATGSPLLS